MRLIIKLKEERGLTLVEILISAIFLTLISVGILGIFTSGYLVLQRTVTFHRATELARHKIEELQNVPIEDIYPADETKDDLDCLADGILTICDAWVPPNPGSDVAVYCPICGYLNRPQNSGDYYDIPDTDANGIPNCQNPDKNYDGVYDDPCEANLPGPGEIGFYTREVRVHAYKDVFETADTLYDYTFDPAVGETNLGREAPVKEIRVKVVWNAMGETQSFEVSTLLSRISPKYSFKELGW